MKTIELSKASKPLSEYAKDLSDDVLVLTSRKKPVAALVRLASTDPEILALNASADFWRIIEIARKQLKSGRSLTLSEIEASYVKPESKKRRQLGRRT